MRDRTLLSFPIGLSGVMALTAVMVLTGAIRGQAALAAQPTVPAVAPSPPPPPAPPPLVVPVVPVNPPAVPGSPAPGADAPPALPAPVPPPIDAAPSESDHDAVVERWGVVVRPVASTLSVSGLRPGTGCPQVVAAGNANGGCPDVSMASLSARRWLDRTLAIDVGLSLATGGGSEGDRLVDTYFGFGPVVGASILLANWKHLAVAASPELALVIFKGAGSAKTAYVADLSANLEAELHFGFIGAPALSIGIRSGLLFRLEHAGDVTLWSVGVGPATTISSVFHDVALRYYF